MGFSIRGTVSRADAGCASGVDLVGTVTRAEPTPGEVDQLGFDCDTCKQPAGSWCVYLDIKPPCPPGNWDYEAAKRQRAKRLARYRMNGQPTDRLHNSRATARWEWEQRAGYRATQEYLREWVLEWGWIFKEGPV